MSTPTKPVIEERIYIGNVHYKTTEEELKALFGEYKLLDIEIPFLLINKAKDKQFKKYLGFAFAQFESKEEADKVLENLNGHVLHNRKISMRKAVPPLTEDEKKVKIEEYKAKKAAKKLEPATEDEKTKKSEKTDSSEKTDKNDSSQKFKNGKVAAKPAAPQGKVSQDTIFITNLDHKVRGKDLYSLFKALKPKWVHIPTRKVSGYKKKDGDKPAPKRVVNKGIAFVKFSDEETQKKAIAEFNGKVVNDREIIVDVAVDARIPKVEGVDGVEGVEGVEGGIEKDAEEKV